MHLSNLWLWPLTAEHVDHQNAIGKLVNTSIIPGIGNHYLWWHIGRAGAMQESVLSDSSVEGSGTPILVQWHRSCVPVLDLSL